LDQRFIDLLTSLLPLLGDRSLQEDTPLRDLGLDSMLAVELLFGIEDVFGVPLPDEELNDATFATADSLWQAVRALIDAEEVA
jgi:acyl carrier protein